MKRFAAALHNDVRFQFRHGFYWAYLVVTAMYAVLLSFLPESSKPLAVQLIVFSDPSALGFFFIGGIVLLEKGQQVTDCLFVTPLLVREYIAAKVASLGLLSVAAGTSVHLFALGPGSLTAWFLIGVALTSAFFTLIGLGVAARCRTLNGFFLLSPLYTLVFLPPLFGTVGFYDTPLYYALPTQASLLLIGSGHEPVGPLQAIGLIGLLAAWTAAAYACARRAIATHIVGTVGGASA